MNRKAGFAVIAAVILAVSALAVASLASGAGAEGDKAKDVIMIRCATDATTFTVTAYQGSANTPARRADNCPEVLGQLLRKGYEIGDVGYSRVDSNFVVFTMLH